MRVSTQVKSYKEVKEGGAQGVKMTDDECGPINVVPPLSKRYAMDHSSSTVLGSNART